MGKRPRGRVNGSHRSPSSSPSFLLLRRRIMAVGPTTSSSSPATVADELRSRFPEYRRHSNPTVFITLVSKALNSFLPATVSGSTSNTSASGDEIGADESEDRLHRRRRLADHPQVRADDVTSSSSGSDDYVTTATFDLTKSMLRNNYLQKHQTPTTTTATTNNTKTNENSKSSSSNLEEIEVATEKPRRLSTAYGGGEDEAPTRNAACDEVGSSNGEEAMVPGPRFRDLGGMESVIEELMFEVIVPLCHPQLLRRLGVRPMAGLLLHGPPGCGKTTLARAIANEAGVPFYSISAPEVVSGVSGASEDNIRVLFKKAYRTAPSIIFIDEIDAIASKRENLQREMERRIVTQLMTCMDEFHQTFGSENGGDSETETSKQRSGYVLVIGATNRPDAVDQALRRPGRFDREISLGVPNENARIEILTMLTRKGRNSGLEGQFDLFRIARATPGFVGADLEALWNKAGSLTIRRPFDKRRSQCSHEHEGSKKEDWVRQQLNAEEEQSVSITMADLEEAAKLVQPTLRREGFSSVPTVTWEDVGGLDALKKEFDRYIVQRIKHPEYYEEFGVNLAAGFLLFGPPGCGKTLIAKAVANEAGTNFIHIKGPEILNKFVGESESEVRKIFFRARTNAPCIVFFDEVDALTTKRSEERERVVGSVLNQLLVELDGADQRQGVYVIGATNRVEVMDPAVLRPGRFGKILYVPLPGADQRVSILKAHARSKTIAVGVDLDTLARREECNNLTGADLAYLVEEAAMAAVEEKLESMNQGTRSSPRSIEAWHFDRALSKVKPSVTEKQRSYYEALSKTFGYL